MGLLDRFRGPPSKDNFARMVLQAIRKADGKRDVVYDADEFRIVFREDGNEVNIMNLGNFYAEYCRASHGDRSRLIPKMVKHALFSQIDILPDDYEDATHDLRPKIWTRSSFEQLRLRQEIDGKESLDTLYQEVGEHLFLSVVYDLPESIRSISPDEFEKWGVTFYEALELARRNLEETPFAFASLDDRVYASMTGDNYDSARLVLHDVIRKLELDGDPIAMVPNRDHLIITGADDEVGMRILCELAEKALEEPRPLIATPLRFNGEEWEDWMPPSDHPLYDKFKLLEMNWLGGEYAHQKQLLEALHEKRGIDVFVATFSGAQKEGGDAFSYCVWGEGIDTLLPHTQKIMFLRDEKLVASGDWDRVRKIVPDLMVPVEAYPARFQVTEFPTEAQLDAIGTDV